ncbi:hypothetical protein niasHS_002180 [Heterodera schachtii]|uniref:Helicase ARIP4 n=1 Tax=Heterodera schachtii TaxID=97005 RepID=A0ABD2KMX9_HETSC
MPLGECGGYLIGEKTDEDDEEEEKTITPLLKRTENTVPSSTQSNFRKRKLKNFDSSMISEEAKEAQRLEKERLDRIEKNKKELDAAAYAPVKTGVKSVNLDDHSFDELVQLDDDDEIEEIGSSVKAEIDLIELGSSDDEIEVDHPSTSAANSHGYVAFQQSIYGQLCNSERFRFRRRRRSVDYDTTETGADGRLLINAGKPDSDPEVFVAEHLTNVLQPHQIGGVKFMYDNIIESLETFHKSAGFGCILAHSMGLGKSIQAITFLEIFIRITGKRRVLLICPVNVLQNWHNEFNRWMPETDAETARPIRHFELFVIGDSVKTLENRAQMIENWYQSGGVLLLGYEMFRLLVHQCELLGEKSTQRKKASKKQPLRTVYDLADDLGKINEQEKAQMTQKDELQRNIRQALLSPGPDLVICDEGHRIKNLNTEVSCALSAINTKRRIVLTGYPIQNNLTEYFCMVEFVRPSYLGSKKDFQLMFDKPIRNGSCTDSAKSDVKLAKQRIHVLCDMLRGFVQRRSQHLLKKILPENREFVVLLRKSELQHSLYRAFHHFASEQISVGESSFNPLKAFAICLKIANHPDMLYAALKKHQMKCQNRTIGCDSNKTGLCHASTSVQLSSDHCPSAPIHRQSKNPSPPIGDVHQSFVNGFASSSLNGPNFGSSVDYWQPNSDQYFPTHPTPIHQSQHRPPNQQSLYFPQHTFGQQHFEPNAQQYNFFPRPSPVQCYPYQYQQSPQQQQQQCQGTSQFFPPPPPFIPPPTHQQPQYRHQFFTMDYDYSTFGRFNQQQPRWYYPSNGAGNGNSMQTEFAMPTQTKREMETPNEQQQQNCNEAIELPCVNEKGGQRNGSERPKQTIKRKPQQMAKGEECDLLSDEFLFENGNSIDLEWAEPILRDHVTGLVEHSSKMFVAMAIISETIRRGEKILLFSQSVVTLNLIEQFLKKHSGEPIGPDGAPVHFVRNETYCRLDGSTSSSDREKLINKFNQNSALLLFLISTRAGGLGVNLVSANRVIIFDVSWNPVHDAQAVCRIYRYGQRRRTYIYRLIMSNCMEKQVFNRQLSKHGLQKRIVDEQLIEANVTTKEVENLLAYDESLDVLLAADQFKKEMKEESNELDDDLLKMLLLEFPHKFFELPFLHESMMVEQEEDLSAEEKLEAQLLYEREKRGINFPPQQSYGAGQPDLFGTNLPPPSLYDRRHFLQNFGNPFMAPHFQRPWHSTPLPKRIEFATVTNQPPRKHQQPTASPVMVINEPMLLPKVIPTKGEQKMHTLKAGDQITMFRSNFGVYFRTIDGVILDATDTQYGRILMQQSNGVPPPPPFVRRPSDPGEIIQIDD